MKVNSGNDFQAQQMGGSAVGTSAHWIALTANTATPSPTDVVLAGEILTPGGGLIRASAAYAHTTGVATYTLTNTFTANSSDALPVTIAKIGVFNQLAGPGGTLVFETLLTPSSATLSAAGDQLTITETVTM